MKTKRYSITELNVDSKELKEIIDEIINSQIKSLRLQSLTSWERDHSKPIDAWDEKIARLKELKDSLKSDLSDENNSLFDVKFSIEVGVKKKHETLVELEEV